MRPRIAVDMDEVLADTMHKFIDLYEERYGRRLQREDYWGKKIYRIDGVSELRNVLFDEGFFRDLKRDAEQPGSDCRNCRSTTRYSSQRRLWSFAIPSAISTTGCWSTFPFLKWKNFVFCGDKSIVRADYMIDDHANNLAWDFRERACCLRPVTIFTSRTSRG